MAHHLMMRLAPLVAIVVLSGCGLGNNDSFDLSSYGKELPDSSGPSLRAEALGAVPNDGLDDAAAIQAAINLASATGMALHIGGGVFDVHSPLAIPSTGGARIYGDGKTVTVLKAHGTFSSILAIGDNAAQTIRGCIQDIQLNALDATVQYGVYGTRVEEHDFVRVACFGFRSAGFSIGFGYVNNYLQCEASYCWGNGFETNSVFGYGGNNSLSYHQCMALVNKGWGIKAAHGYHIAITACTIEVNDMGGVYLNNFPAATIRAYFEGNGAVGQTFVTPAVTVKADILLNGSATDTELNPDYPCRGVSISGCYTYPLPTSNAFVWNGGAVDARIGECYTGNSAFSPCVAQHANPFYRGSVVTIENCSSFAVQVSEVGGGSP